jgi:limonene-1,2-epoxide hydrolase
VTAETIVTGLCLAFERLDADELIGYFSDEAVYHNVPLPPSRGRAQIYASLSGLRSRFKAVRVEMLHTVSAGDLVMNERIDHFTFHDGAMVSLPIAGIFELESGKVVAWRDYFDLATFTRHATPRT